MRYIAIPLLLMVAILPHYVFAQTGNQLDTTSIPDKIISNTNGIIQVYPKEFNNTIDNLVATSSDSSIVQILGVEKDPAHNVYDIKIGALTAGKTTISIAASGFSPLELPLTVYADSAMATNLLVKATPNTFSTSGPDSGYIAVETVNSDGVPTPVTEDTPIKLSVSDSSIASVSENQMIIKQGSYYTTEKFIMTKPGSVKIYATAPSMQPVYDSVTMNNEAVPYTLRAYAYPPLVNVNTNSLSYVIVQLHDAAGNPVIAKEDIPVSVRIVNPDDEGVVNTSGQSPFVQVNGGLVIKKGSYWGDIPVEFTAGINATYNVVISAKGYVISTAPLTTTVTTSITTSTGSTAPGSSTSTSGTTTTTSKTSASGTTTTTSTASTSGTTTSGQTKAEGTTTASGTSVSICSLDPVPTSTSQIQIATVEQNFVMADKTPCFYPLPILSTGNNELIGVMALKDPTGYPALAKSDLSFKIDSSDVSTVSVPGITMGYGSQSALVFAKVGNAANPVMLNVISDSPQQVTPIDTSPSQSTSGLVADPLLSKVMPNTEFPLAVFATKDGALGSLSSDFGALISPQESIAPIQISVTKTDPIFLTEEKLLKVGTQNIAITTPDYASTFTVTGASTNPQGVALDYPDQITSNSNLMFSVELLDEKNLPILASRDMDIKLISSNPSVLNVPDSVSIKQGSYYATFDAHSMQGGTAELAVLADGIPLSKFEITSTSYVPVVKLDSADHADNHSPVTVTAEATYNKSPLAGLPVEWTVSGAAIQKKDSETNSEGKAAVTVITNNPNAVKIQANVGGGPYQVITASKQIGINPPLLAASPNSQSSQTNPSQTGVTIMGMNPILFIIPGAAAAAFVVLKKKNMLEGISERINLADKFSGIRGRMSGAQET